MSKCKHETMTADTITDEQILELREWSWRSAFVDAGTDIMSAEELRRACNLALLAPGGIGLKHEYREARGLCAHIMNIRGAA